MSEIDFFHEFRTKKALELRGWRVSEPYSASRQKDSPVQKLTTELAKLPPKVFAPLSEQEILAMQQASTQKNIQRTQEEREAYWASPLSDEAQVRDEMGNVFVGPPRSLSPEEFYIERNLKNNRSLENEPMPPSVSPERRDKAIQAYCYSPGTTISPEDAHKITGLKPIESESPAEEEPEAEPKKILGCSFTSNAAYIFGIKVW